MLIDNAAPTRAATVTHTTIPSELGDLTVVACAGAVIGLYFPHHWYRPDATRFGSFSHVGFGAVGEQIGDYLAGARREFEVDLTTNGDEYQERIWSLVREIRYGET